MRPFIATLLLGAAGCGTAPDEIPDPDGAADPGDASVVDAGDDGDAAILDAAILDAAILDAAILDAAILDAQAPAIDAAWPDAALPDASPPDAPSPPDATSPPPGALPDLLILDHMVASSIFLTETTFPHGHCALNECLDAPGDRKLLRFDTPAANLGEGDLTVGGPQHGHPLWEWDPCHQHWHYKDFASYELVDENGLVAAGHKQSFCLIDVLQIVPGAPSSGYDCHNQGLSAGWADLYAAGLDCQWIDVTDVPPGNYTLKITVNPNGTLAESNYDNNVAAVPVTLP